MLQSDPRSKGPSATLRAIALSCVLALALGASFGGSLGVLGCASDGSGQASEEVSEEGKIEPRYQPREPIPEPWYNSDYLFGMTRGVTNSTIHPGAQVPLLVLTIPLDIVFLPFAAIGGFF
jgi:hypothetical protein